MKLFRRRTYCVAVALCLLLICPVRTHLRGEPAPSGLKIYGTVVDATPDCSQKRCAMLASAESEEDAERILGELLGQRPASNVVVTAKNKWVTREVVSDSEGTFTFTNLPQGIYEVSAETPSQPSPKDGKRKVSAKKRVRVVEHSGIVRLALHEELVTVSGRITDVHGQPVAGAKVTGTPVPVREVGLIDRVSTVSDADGSYELQGFAPLNLYRVAGYLNGGSLEAPGSLYTYVEIRVEADGFVQGKQAVLKVPLVAEAQLVPARRLWKALSQLATTMGEGEGWQEMKQRHLPSCQGNTITDIDVVLDNAPKQTSVDHERRIGYQEPFCLAKRRQERFLAPFP